MVCTTLEVDFRHTTFGRFYPHLYTLWSLFRKRKRHATACLFSFCVTYCTGFESPCLCRYDRQKHSGGVFLGRSDAVTNIMRCRNDRARQNAFWRNRDSIASPATSTKNRQVSTCRFFIHCESNGISSRVSVHLITEGVYHQPQAAFLFAMMIYKTSF